MRSCIIQTDDISIKKVYGHMKDADKYNWLITNIECYPTDDTIVSTLDGDYCWIKGKELVELLNKEDFQWIWGVFSAFPDEVPLDKVLMYNLPYADGYKGFWTNPVSVQHPLAEIEIVAWDSSLILAISKDDLIVERIMNHEPEAKDLVTYNLEETS